jgi:hypothetical protein
MDKLIKDVDHWQNQKPPLCPNPYEIELYSYHSNGLKPVCLLGMTKELQFLCDYMVDLYPIPQNKPVIEGDWNDINDKVGVMIGDGITNLEGLQLVDKLLKNCNRLVCRVFLKKFSWMKYAKHFPNEFPNAKFVIPTQEDIAIVVWENS